MITGITTCPLCGDECREELLDHLVTHVRPLARPDAKTIREKLNATVGDGFVDDAMFHVEHLIADEWGPVTQGARLDTLVTVEVTEVFSTIAGALMLSALDRLTEVLGDDGADVQKSPQKLRWEVKVSPLWE